MDPDISGTHSVSREEVEALLASGQATGRHVSYSMFKKT